MPKLVIALAIAVVGVGPVVASQENDVMAPVRQFVDGFNKSDIKWPRPLALIKFSSSTIFHLTSDADQEPPENGFMI